MKIKVLLVDDHPFVREGVKACLLRYEQFEVVGEASSGQEAIEKAREFSPDIIVMDIMMPEMDGIDTMREIRRLAQFRHLPIIAVTAKAMKGDREKCIEAGAWDYLAKPVDTDQLLSVLRAWLDR